MFSPSLFSVSSLEANCPLFLLLLLAAPPPLDTASPPVG